MSPGVQAALQALEWRAWQVAWYRGVLRKTFVFALAHSLLVWVGLSFMHDDPSVPPPFEESEAWRVVLTAVCCLLAWVTMYLDVWHATPPEHSDPKKVLLEQNVNGHFTYLTFHILFATLFYWNTCLVAELAWLYGLSHDAEMAWARKLLKLCYASSALVSAFGVVLAVLFLKFNWFEPAWRETVLNEYHRRGHTAFGPTILFTHLNQTPASLLDMTVVKNRPLLAASVAGLGYMAAAIAAYSVYYLAGTHINFHLTKEYPYPFFHKVLANWKTETIFVGAIVFFVNFITLFMTTLATSEVYLADFASAIFYGND